MLCPKVSENGSTREENRVKGGTRGGVVEWITRVRVGLGVGSSRCGCGCKFVGEGGCGCECGGLGGFVPPRPSPLETSLLIFFNMLYYYHTRGGGEDSRPLVFPSFSSYSVAKVRGTGTMSISLALSAFRIISSWLYSSVY